MERAPYVISEDIEVLLKEWAKTHKFRVPNDDCFKELRQEFQKKLEKIFGKGNVDMISSQELKKGMKELIDRAGLPAVSMDRVYVRTTPSIEVSRVVDKSLNDYGIAPRFGALPFNQQLIEIRKKFKEIVLVDDVIFSGKVISEIIFLLNKIGVKVPVVVAGVTIGKGAKALKKKTGTEILTVRYYEKVIDEICERDFYPGVPLSGRLIAGEKVEIGAPYFLPFGKPFEWATIPKEEIREFSLFCLTQTIKLWEAVEKVSQKIVKCKDLERLPNNIPNNSSSFLEKLQEIKYLLGA